MSIKKDRWHCAKQLRKKVKQLSFVDSQKLAKAVLDENYLNAAEYIAYNILNAKYRIQDDNHGYFIYYYANDDRVVLQFDTEELDISYSGFNDALVVNPKYVPWTITYEFNRLRQNSSR